MAESVLVSIDTLLAEALVMATLLLGKVAHIGDVTVRAEGQPAVLSQVTHCGEVVVLGNIAFLGVVPAVIITSICWCNCQSCWCCCQVTCASQPALRWHL